MNKAGPLWPCIGKRIFFILFFISSVSTSCSYANSTDLLATLEKQVTVEWIYTPSATPTLTPVPTLTPTQTPTPIPVGGGSGRLAFVDDPFFGRFDIIYLVNVDGSGAIQLTTNLHDTNPAWSPDGKRIIFTSAGDTGETRKQIYVMNQDGSNQTQLSGCLDCFGAAWSPDGMHIVYVSSTYGISEIYVMNADGSGQTRLPTTVGGGSFDPAWSPNGAKIVYAASLSGGNESQIFVMNADGTKRTQLTNNPGRNYSPAWSPDGKRIAFSYANNWINPTIWEIFVMNADGSGLTRLTYISKDNKGEGCYNPAWSPDGTYISSICGSFDRIWGTIHVIDVASHMNMDTKIYARNSNGSKAVWQP